MEDLIGILILIGFSVIGSVVKGVQKKKKKGNTVAKEHSGASLEEKLAELFGVDIPSEETSGSVAERVAHFLDEEYQAPAVAKPDAPAGTESFEEPVASPVFSYESVEEIPPSPVDFSYESEGKPQIYAEKQSEQQGEENQSEAHGIGELNLRQAFIYQAILRRPSYPYRYRRLG